MPITEPIDPTAIYICDEPFHSENGTCRRDDLFRGSHILVSAHPMFFSPADALEDERGSAWKSFEAEQREKGRELAAAEAAKRERQARANRVRLEAPVVMQATADIVGEYENRPALISKGSTVYADDPLVAAHSDMFEPAK